MDYLYPRLFRPLGIVNVKWQESPEGINCGGWGLYLKTEDLAKMGQLFLQKGKWDGQQVLPEEWIAEASAKQVASFPAGMVIKCGVAATMPTALMEQTDNTFS